MKNSTNFEVIKFSTEPVRCEIMSEVYLCFQFKKYIPVIDLKNSKSKQMFSFVVGASSVAQKLESFRVENGGLIVGTELWIHRESDDKMAKYIMEN